MAQQASDDWLTITLERSGFYSHPLGVGFWDGVWFANRETFTLNNTLNHFSKQPLFVDTFVSNAVLLHAGEQRLDPILLHPLHLKNHEDRGISVRHREKVHTLAMESPIPHLRK